MGLKISKNLRDKMGHSDSDSKLKISKDLRDAVFGNGSKDINTKDFRIPTDLDLESESEKKNNYGYRDTSYDIDRNSVEEIQKYLDSISSGIRYDYESERGMVCEEGDTIVFSIDEVIDMVNNGYNIISANCLNKDMIQIKYQGFMKRRGR